MSLLSALSAPNDAVPVIAGPTAVGKTALSIELAEQLDAEIVSADSRQIYREMTIGTAKPGPEDLARVRHHFIDELSLPAATSAGSYAVQALDRIEDIRSRGHRAVVVGGSTLYLHALIHGLADVPPVDIDVRRDLEGRLLAEGQEALFEELAAVDPAFAKTLDPTKTQRLVRGLEVYYGTGRPLSDYFADQGHRATAFEVLVLHRPREVLYHRINRRVDDMLTRGLLDEVRGILSAGIERSAGPLRTIGYQEPLDYLDGSIGYEEMVRLIKRNSRRYAKRQLTWFRRYPSYRFVELD